jgi:hypothetical protein
VILEEAGDVCGSKLGVSKLDLFFRLFLLLIIDASPFV